MTALTVGAGTIEAGFLSTDEICSPVQMVLDHDLAGGYPYVDLLRQVYAQFCANPEDRLTGCFFAGQPTLPGATISLSFHSTVAFRLFPRVYSVLLSHLAPS